MKHDTGEAFEASADMLCIAGLDGHLRKVNRAFQRSLGWTTAELLQRSLLDFVHPDDVEATSRAVNRLASGPGTSAFENRVRCSDGTYKHLSWASFPEKEAGLLYAVVRDMSETKREHANLLQLSSAVEMTADAVMITDRSGAFEYVNPAFELTTGYTAAEVKGLTPRILKSGVHPPEFYHQLWANLLAGNVFRGIVVNRRKNGELYHAEQSITPMTNPEGVITHFVSVVKDITERKRREEQDLELRVASTVQQRLYPEQTPQVEGFDLAGAAFPVHAMCGDYFDFITLRDGCQGIAIGDVSGHGLGQALLMVQTRAYLRSMARFHTDVGEILTSLDESLTTDLQPGWFVSLLLVRLDPQTRVFQFANAGHLPGYLLDSSGAIKTVLNSTGLPLGLPAEMSPGRVVGSSPPLAFEYGDVLVLLTDGITEAKSPEGVEFGSEGFLGVMGTHGKAAAQVILDGVNSAVRGFSSGFPQRDDMTIVVCKCLPREDTASLPAASGP